MIDLHPIPLENHAPTRSVPRSGGPMRAFHVDAVRARRKLDVSQRILRAIAHLGERPPRRLLEIGFGHGILLSEVHRRWPQAELVGVDRSATMAAHARDRNADALVQGRLTLVEADLLDYRYRGETFDTIVSINLGAIGQPETTGRLLFQAVRGLAEGGRWIDVYDSPSGTSVARHAEHAQRVFEEAGLSPRVMVRGSQRVEIVATR